MSGIHVEIEIEQRLARVSKQTGRSVRYHANRSIRDYLEDREDYMAGIAALRRKESRISLEDLERELGFAD